MICMMCSKLKDKRIKKGEETKAKILKASIELFSKNGYDATSVNDISKKAKLTKSLLYHHFKNKESILIQIMNDSIKEVKEIFNNVAEKTNPANIEEFHFSFYSILYDYLYNNKKIIKILLSESFKNYEITFNMFNVFNEIKEHFNIIAGEHHIKKRDDELSFKLEEFYIHFLAPIIFSVLNDSWCDYYKTSNEEVQKKFINIMNRIELCNCDSNSGS